MVTDGVEMGVLPGMGDIPERTTPTHAVAPEANAAGRRKRTSKKGKRQPAETLPVARVAVDMSLPHLDRPFDYLVPTTLDATAVPGCRVRVRFAGQLVDGFLLERAEQSDHEGRLAYLERVTSPEPVLAPEIAALAREIADRYAGTLADVLRLAIPPRHARVEAENPEAPSTTSSETDEETATGAEAAADATSATDATPQGDEGRPSAGPGLTEDEQTGETTAGTTPADHPASADHPMSPVDEGQAHETGRDSGEPETSTASPGQATEAAGDVVAARGAESPVAEGETDVGTPHGGHGSAGDTEAAANGPETAAGTAPAAPSAGGAGSPPGVASAESGEVPSRRPVATAGGAGAPTGEGEASAGGSASMDERQVAASVARGGSAEIAEAPARVVLSRGSVASAGEAPVEAGPWEAYPAGVSFLGALQAGRAPRAVWSALPGGDWTAAVARAAHATLTGGRGVLIVVADGRDVARMDAALAGELGPGRHVALTAELGPAERYRRWLAVRRGRVKAVVGTRAAIFAPVRDLGLVVLWDDGDDVHAEPHAPYPHAREVLALRAHRANAGALIGGFTRTTDSTQLVAAGWAHPLVPDRERLRGSMAYIRPSGDDADLARDEAARSARLPHLAFRTARQGLEHGPVLVQVPRRGYVPALACSRCRGPARCSECEGPLSLRSSHAAPYCRWCGRIAGAWTCPECGGRQVRAVVVGARRTAEELGRAFPGVPVRTSGRDGVLAEVTGEPALVVATPGAEPVAEGGYAAALLLDGWVLLGRADLRAGEEALRRWMNAAALVRPRGPVIVLADGSLTPVQALIRWDAVTYAERELEERRELGFPPAVRMASLTGTPQSIRELVDAAGLPEDAEVLGPVELDDGQERALVRVDRARGVALSRLLKAAQATRSTRKTTEVVRVRVDPLELI
jgi:primosomal protein N' (replication factor Y)